MPPRDVQTRLKVFGRATRHLRLDLEMSQDAVERRGGMARNVVGHVERAEKDVKLSTVMRLADGLGVPLSELVAAYEQRLRDS